MRKYGIVLTSCQTPSGPLPSRCICSQPSHPPGVPVLVSDLFLHLCISEGFREGAPDICLALVPEGIFNRWHLTLREDVALLMPGQLAPDAIENCSGKLAAKTQVGAQLPAELLWVVSVVGDVPLELVDQADVAQVDVQLDHHPLVLLLLQ